MQVPIPLRRYLLSPTNQCNSHTDWKDSETDLAHLGGAAPGAAKSGGDKLWEDNWDDDDIEDEFSVQLRCVSSPLYLEHISHAIIQK